MSEQDVFEHEDILKSTLQDMHAAVLNSPGIKTSSNWKTLPLVLGTSIVKRRKSQVYLAAVSILLVLATGAGIVIGSINKDSNSPDKVKTVDKVKTSTTTTITISDSTTTIAPSTTLKPGTKTTTKSGAGPTGGGSTDTSTNPFPAGTINPAVETVCGYSNGGETVTNPYFKIKKSLTGKATITFYKSFNASISGVEINGQPIDPSKNNFINSIPLNRETVIGETQGYNGVINLEISFSDSVHAGNKKTTIGIGGGFINTNFPNQLFIQANSGAEGQFNLYMWPDLNSRTLSQYQKFFGTGTYTPNNLIFPDNSNVTSPWSTSAYGYNAVGGYLLSASTFFEQPFTEGRPGCQVFIDNN